MEIVSYLAPIVEKNGVSTLFLLLILYMLWKGSRWIVPQVVQLALSYLEIQKKKNVMLEDSIEVTHALQRQTISAIDELKVVVASLTDLIKSRVI